MKQSEKTKLKKSHLEHVRGIIALRRTERALAHIQTQIDETNRVFESLQELIRRQVADRYHEEFPDKPIPKQENITFGDWQCLKSPTRQCVYDLESPYGEDECLYCGCPNERK